MNSDTTPIPKSHQDLIRRCTTLNELHKQNKLGPSHSRPLAEQAKIISLLWDTQAQIIAAGLSRTTKTQTREDAPGYVFITKENTSFAVPFFLADYFPDDTLLQEIIDLSRKIRVSASSIICLSGSGCSLGLNIPIGDLDFCEYISSVDEYLAERLVQATRLEDSNITCIAISIGPRMQWRRPWSTDLLRPTRKLVSNTTKALKKNSHRKIDYIARTDNLGVLEVTNKLVALDVPYPDTGEAASSFSMQEAPIDNNSWVPRNLSNPIEVGRYVSWLMTEVKELLVKSRDNPRLSVKALRRALSLARIIMARDETSELRRLLIEEDGGRLAALYDRCTLFKEITGIAKDENGQSDLTSYQNNLRISIIRLRNKPESELNSSEIPFDSLTTNEAEALTNFSNMIRPKLKNIVSQLDLILSYPPTGC